MSHLHSPFRKVFSWPGPPLQEAARFIFLLTCREGTDNKTTGQKRGRLSGKRLLSHINWFIHQKCSLLCSGHCTWWWCYNSEEDRQDDCSQGGSILLETQKINRFQTGRSSMKEKPWRQNVPRGLIQLGWSGFSRGTFELGPKWQGISCAMIKGGGKGGRDGKYQCSQDRMTLVYSRNKDKYVWSLDNQKGAHYVVKLRRQVWPKSLRVLSLTIK